MIRTLTHIIILLILLCIVGCTDNESIRALEHAETIMEEYPDSALIILNTINPRSLRSDRYKAKYALLTTQSQIKNDYPIESDSLIRIAVNYYSAGKESTDLMKSMFYHAEVLRNLGNLSSAVKYATHSYELARKFNDPYWIAKSAEQLMFIFSAAHCRAQSLKYSKIACDFYAKAGKRLNHLYSLCDYGIDLNNANNYENAIPIFDSIIKLTSIQKLDSGLLAYANNSKLYACIELEKDSDAMECLRRMRQLSAYLNQTPLDKIYDAILNIRRGNLDYATILLNEAQPSCTNDTHKCLLFETYINLYKAEDNQKLAAQYLDSALQIQNRAMKIFLTNEVLQSQKDFYNSQYKNQERKTTNYKIMILVITIIVCVVIALIMLIYRRAIRRKNKKIEKNIKDILILTSQIEENKIEHSFLLQNIDANQIENIWLQHKLNELDSENSTLIEIVDKKNEDLNRLTSAVLLLFKDQWKTLNALCYEYFEKGDSELTRNTILKNVENQINQLRDPKALKGIETSVNKYMNGVINKIRKECSFFKETDITFITLLIAGLSPRAICMLLDIQLKNYYSKRSRIIKRIESSACSHKWEFISYLSNNQHNKPSDED